jgi:cytochrome b561
MAGAARSERYHWGQIALHWVVAGLVVVQYATSGSIERTHHAEHLGQEPSSLDLFLHAVHNRAGLFILALMLVRLALHWRMGAPAPIAGSHSSLAVWRSRAAKGIHAAFYAVLIAQALTGATAAYLYWPAARLHSVLAIVTLGLVALHAAAVLWHHAVERDETLWRMLGRRHGGAAASKRALAPAE